MAGRLVTAVEANTTAVEAMAAQLPAELDAGALKVAEQGA